MADSGKLAPSPKHPPHSMEAEQSVLGGLMLNNRMMDDVIVLLREEDFYTQDHRAIFRALLGLHDKRKPLDFVTLSEYLREREELQDVGGLAYLGTLAADTPSAANVMAYAEIVRERSVLRTLIAAGQDIAELGFQPAGRPSGDLIDVAETKVFSIRDLAAGARSTVKDMPTVVTAIEERVIAARENGEVLMGLSTGFSALDRLTTGFHPGDLIIVGGRPGMGKTSFAMAIAEHAALDEKKAVAVFSMEMPAEQLTMRTMSSHAQIELTKIREANMSDEEFDRFIEFGIKLREAKLLIDDSPALSPRELAARARRMAARGPLSLIVVDYIQLMQVPDSKENRTNIVSEISRGLKALAKELKVPVIALSQLSRNLETRTDKRPKMSDLRESGGIEQDADIILFVYREEYHDKATKDKGLAEIIIGKQRNGPQETAKVGFEGQYTKFGNLAANWCPDPTGPDMDKADRAADRIDFK